MNRIKLHLIFIFIIFSTFSSNICGQELQSRVYAMGANFGYPITELSVDVTGGDWRIARTNLFLGTNVMGVNVDYYEGDILDDAYLILNFLPLNSRYILNTKIKENTKYYIPKYVFFDLKYLSFISHKSVSTGEKIFAYGGPQIKTGLGIDFNYHRNAKITSFSDGKTMYYMQDAEEAKNDKRPGLLKVLNPNIGFRLGYSYKPTYLDVGVMERVSKSRHFVFLEIRMELGGSSGVCRYR